MNWVDKQYLRVSHFGIHPNELKRNNNRFDTFHIPYAITRKFMEYLQEFMLSQSREITVTFSDLLLTFLTQYNALMWKLNYLLLYTMESSY